VESTPAESALATDIFVSLLSQRANSSTASNTARTP